MNVRSLSPLDRLLAGVERALETVAGAPEAASRRSRGESERTFMATSVRSVVGRA